MLARSPRRPGKDRRYRQRQRDGLTIYRVPLADDAVRALVRWQWLDARSIDDKDAVADAVRRMLADAVRSK
jgi:hypothetical protein